MKQRKKRIMLLLSLTVVLSFSLSTIFSIYSLNILISENNRDKSIVYAEEITSTINSFFSAPLAVAMSLNNPYIQELAANTDKYTEDEFSTIMQNYLSNLIDYFHYDTAFVTPESNHHFYTEHGMSKVVNFDNPDDDWYENFINSGAAYEMNVDNDQANDNRTTIYINVRMDSPDGELLGICGIGLTMDQISKKISSFESIEGYNVMLVSKNGQIKVSSNSDYQKEKLTQQSTHLYKNVSEEILSFINNYDRSKNYNYISKGKDSFYILRYIDYCQWYLVIDYSSKSIPGAYSLLLKNILTCLGCLLVLLIISNIIMNYVQNRMNAIKHISEHDKLTGIPNRHSYEDKIRSLHTYKSLENVTVAVLDIDSLKRVNDNIGHAAGDELIIGAAKLISSYFSIWDGITYRIGGDEFVVIIEKPFDDIPVRISEFKDTVSNWKGKLIDKMHISIGIVPGSIYEYVNIDELIELADHQMYDDKNEYYKNAGIERRKA